MVLQTTIPGEQGQRIFYILGLLFCHQHLRPAASTVIIAFQAMTCSLLMAVAIVPNVSHLP